MFDGGQGFFRNAGQAGLSLFVALMTFYAQSAKPIRNDQVLCATKTYNVRNKNSDACV
jgi:hypothetical protein